MIIDANMYWIPETLFTDVTFRKRFLDCVNMSGEVHAEFRPLENTGKKQFVFEEPAGYENLNYVQGEYEAGEQLQAMDEAGVDMAILKVPGCHAWMDMELCRRFNDGMAEHVKKSRGRFAALAVVRPDGGKESIRELERCVKELGMTGIQISTHYSGKYLDAPEFRPFFQKVNELKLPVYVHHAPIPADHGSIYEYNNLRRSYGRCVDQTTAIGRELFSGMFHEFPEIRMVHSMLGGAFFAYMDSMFHRNSNHPAGSGGIRRFDTDTDTQLYQLEHNIFYEVSHIQPWGKDLMECAVRILGADHILFGSSYPVRREWLTKGVGAVREMRISENEKNQILGENALRIYHLQNQNSCETSCF